VAALHSFLVRRGDGGNPLTMPRVAFLLDRLLLPLLHPAESITTTTVRNATAPLSFFFPIIFFLLLQFFVCDGMDVLTIGIERNEQGRWISSKRSSDVALIHRTNLSALFSFFFSFLFLLLSCFLFCRCFII
jgi:hypothetical protein